jgi:cytochrome P450
MYSPKVQNHMDRLCKRLSEEYVANGTILILKNMWGAFTSDIVVGYCLEQPYDFILRPDFRADFSDAMYERLFLRALTRLLTQFRVSLLDLVHFITQFPWMIKITKLFPDWLVELLYPEMRAVNSFNKEMETHILRAKSVHASKEKNDKVALSLFTALLESDLPPSELTTQRLQHEAISVIVAGVETTMYTLSTCSYHLLANPQILAKLKDELVTAISNADEIPDIDSLMQLPYLTNMVNEALRFGYGTPQRIPRLSPTPMVYASPDAEYDLPVESIVSMDHYTASHDPYIFPQPHKFIPERWGGNAKAPDGKPLSRYMIAFGRGTRICVGMQLAYADIYIGVASFLRRLNASCLKQGEKLLTVTWTASCLAQSQQLRE